MLTTLIIFVVDLVLASAVVIILYAAYLIAATGIFLSVIFYIYKGETEKNYDFNKGRTLAVPDSSNATGKTLAGHAGKISSRMLPAVQESAFLSQESSGLFHSPGSSVPWKSHMGKLGRCCPQPTKRSFFRNRHKHFESIYDIQVAEKRHSRKRTSRTTSESSQNNEISVSKQRNILKQDLQRILQHVNSLRSVALTTSSTLVTSTRHPTIGPTKLPTRDCSATVTEHSDRNQDTTQLRE